MEPIETCPIPIPIIPIKVIKGGLQELLNMPVCRSVEVHKAAPGTGKKYGKMEASWRCDEIWQNYGGMEGSSLSLGTS